MKLATLRDGEGERAFIAVSGGFVSLSTLNSSGVDACWPTTAFELIESGRLPELTAWYNAGGREKLETLDAVPADQAMAKLAPLYRRPRKIWGIGMNYAAHPDELLTLPAGEEPVSFMKPDTAMIGEGEAIVLPPQSARVTAEAELAIVIGKVCRNVTEAEAASYVAGYAASIDTTAADIHARHMRYLTRAKSFDTFFTFGSELITPDDVDDLFKLQVETWHNGALAHRNVISNMRFNPWHLIAFHSQVMTLLPGDVIMTGTPGSAVLRAGDSVECRIDGFLPLANTVETASSSPL
ncbi:fumarylacetoacetate hydrolase family protein [Paenibacillus sp. NEAU-GSW1]|uniref:fumarylacetoacetate hydrolase family protein n=1 Tax=Paenibacillus sp. NEAU-GSW1 TaxID=2682486 RepID=UPI0012E1765F|nr:fumarylacetoacetate hydrolase family protein [Paenibacillus sp. NEAU-GSW1]MUT66593.1 fumarylacetoacetate hydrolase [Paenibacillus sp. NEAU-GSW1]